MANMNLILERQKAYINDLKKHINNKNIVDVVLNLTALASRSKTRLINGNKILVAIDSDHNNAPTVYEYDSTNNAWVYKECLTTNYYTQAAINGLLNTERDRITALETEVGPQTNFGSSTLRGRVKALEDSDFQSQIDAINAGQNLADIVGTKTLLNSYVTTNLHQGDKVQVLFDVDHDNASTVYNWTGSAFDYIGKYGQDSYMKSEVYNKTESDILLFGKVDKIDGKGLSTNDFTDLYKGQVDDNTTARHTHSNKSILDQITQDVVDNEHAHTNFALLETYTQTESDLSDAVSKKHSHSNKSILDQVTQDVVDNTHTHSNKAILDDITAAYTIAEQTKLAGIEAGAQVNIPADTTLNLSSNNAVANSVVTSNFNAIMNSLGGKTNFVLSYAAANTDNSIFNSDANTITFTNTDTIKDINGNPIPVSTMLLGDIFLVTETDKPDRWVGSVTKDANDTVVSATLYKMETTKIDLDPYLTAVSYDSTNKKLTYTNNNTAHDIVSIATIKTALELGAAADKAVTNNTSATAFSNSDDNLVTNKTLYYGTPSINNSKAYTSSTSIYAPTGGGTSGQILKSAGSTSTPTWSDLKTINSGSLLGSGNLNLMPILGGQFTGPISFNGTSLPQKTLQFITGIDGFAAGGELGWQSKSDFLSGYATQSWVQQQGYLTSHQSLSGYLPLTGGTLYNPTDTGVFRVTSGMSSGYANIDIYNTNSNQKWTLGRQGTDGRFYIGYNNGSSWNDAQFQIDTAVGKAYLNGNRIITTEDTSAGEITFNVIRNQDVDSNRSKYWAAMVHNTSPTGSWYHIISMDWQGNTTSDWISQIALPTQDGGVPYYRRNNSSGTTIGNSTWHKFITDENLPHLYHHTIAYYDNNDIVRYVFVVYSTSTSITRQQFQDEYTNNGTYSQGIIGIILDNDDGGSVYGVCEFGQDSDGEPYMIADYGANRNYYQANRINSMSYSDTYSEV